MQHLPPSAQWRPLHHLRTPRRARWQWPPRDDTDTHEHADQGIHAPHARLRPLPRTAHGQRLHVPPTRLGDIIGLRWTSHLLTSPAASRPPPPRRIRPGRPHRRRSAPHTVTPPETTLTPDANTPVLAARRVTFRHALLASSAPRPPAGSLPDPRAGSLPDPAPTQFFGPTTGELKTVRQRSSRGASRQLPSSLR